MYTTVQDLIREWKIEANHMQNVLDILTDDALNQSISPHNRTIGRIAWHIVTNIPEYFTQFGVDVVGVEGAEVVPTSAKLIAETFSEVNISVVKAVQTCWTDDDLYTIQEAFGRKESNASIFMGQVKHIIHHRGQLTVLIRQTGLRPPAIYGPTVEDWKRMKREAPTV